MIRIQNSIILLFLFCTFSVSAQENDFQSWYSFSIKKKIVKKIDLIVKSGLRTRENSSIKDKLFLDFKLKRKWTKRFSFATGYRYSNNWGRELEFSSIHRFYADLSYKNDLVKRLDFSLRNRLQSQGDAFGYRMTLRQKFTLAYNIRKSKLTPNIATEYFVNLNNGLNKLRSTVSISHPINKNLDFDVAYRIQQEFYVNNPETLFIFEGKISYNL